MAEYDSGPVDIWSNLEKLHGKRPPWLDFVDKEGLLDGWVINGRLPNNIRNLIKADVTPLMPGGWNPLARLSAGKQLGNIKSQYGDGAFLMAIRDDESMYGVSNFIVVPSDLEKDPDEIIAEASRASIEGNFRESDRLALTYMAVTGMTDTK